MPAKSLSAGASVDLELHAQSASLAHTALAAKGDTTLDMDARLRSSRRYRTMEAAALRLQKEAKGYLDSLRGMRLPISLRSSKKLIMLAMTASQMRIAETIDAFYGDAGAKDGVSRSYKQAVEDLDTETIKALDGPYRYDHTNCLHKCIN